jgi:hypothetical protein
MTSSIISAKRHRRAVSRIVGRLHLFPRPHGRGADTPPPAGPRFRKAWKEVAPGQWQWRYVDDEADQE